MATPCCSGILADSTSHARSIDRRARRAVERRLLELAVPPLELAGDVALAPGEVAEADGVDVDGVQAGQGVDQRLRRRGPGPARAARAEAASSRRMWPSTNDMT